MRNKKIRVAMVFMIVLLIIINGVVYASGAQIPERVEKDETVYAMLKADGSLDYIKVVNRFPHVDGSKGEIIDYGEFKDAAALNSRIQPLKEDGCIKWPVGKDILGDFYYEALIEKELPVTIKIVYILDGREILPEEVGGSQGELQIKINISPNTLCDKVHLKKYMIQLQFGLDLKNTDILAAEGAVSIITGTTANLSYTVLPGETSEILLKLNVKDFQMQPIQITLLDYASMVSNQLGSLIANLESLKTGMGDSVKGLQQINANLEQLIAGYNQLYQGMKQLNEGHNQLVQIASMLSESPDRQIQSLGKGIISEGESIGTLAAALSAANNGLAQYGYGINQLTEGFEQINNGISETSLFNEPSGDDTFSFANSAVKINSLQFVIRTPAVEKATAAKKENVNTTADSESWFQRIWNRILALFIW
jgi:putative membrane protein